MFFQAWLTSNDVRNMTLAQQGLYLRMLCIQARDGSLPEDAYALSRLVGCDHRLIERFQSSFRHLTVKSLSDPGAITVPKLDFFWKKLRNSPLHDVPEQTREEQTSKQAAKQAPAELNATPSLSPEEPHTECPKCGFYPCQQKLFCPKPDSPVLVKKAAKPVAKRPAADPLRNWEEEVDGVPGERIRLCVRFMLDIKKEPWFVSNISVAALRRPGFLHKLVDECPSDGEIQKALKATIKTKWEFDSNCPRKCDRGKISMSRPGSLFPIVEHCECLHEIEVA